MAFDPDAYLATKAAPPATGGGFDPDAYLAQKGTIAAPDKGALNAAGLGALQGVSAGFFDEIAAGLKSLRDWEPNTRGAPGLRDLYHKNVEGERAELHAAQQQHPIASTLGELAGGAATALVPGAGMASLGKGFAANAARGAGAGILSGAGTSEANDVEGVVSDAAKGGLAGAALGGTLGTLAEKGIEGAPARQEGRLIQDITGGRATGPNKQIYRHKELVLSAAKKFGIEPEAAAPAQALQAVNQARQQVGQQIGDSLQAIGGNTLGVKTSELKSALQALKGEYGAPSEAPLQGQIETYIKNMWDRWGGSKRIPIGQLNEEIGNLERVGFAGNDLHPAAAKQLKRDIADALDDVLDKRLEEVKDIGGKVANSSLAAREGFSGIAAAGKAAEGLPDLNRDYRGLKLMQRALEDRASIPPANQAAGGLRDAVGKAVDAGLLFTHPAAFAAKKAGEFVAPRAARAADDALASLYRAAQGGQVTAQMIQAAITAGVPRGLAESFNGLVNAQGSPAPPPPGT